MRGYKLLIAFGLTAVMAFFMFLLGPVSAFATEYQKTYTICYSAKFDQIVRGKGDVTRSFTLYGASVGGDPKSPLHNASFKCLGVGNFVKGTPPEILDYCAILARSGDKAFARCSAGKCTYIGGTGKLAGIKGGSTSKSIGGYPSPQRGIAVNCRTIQSKYTIPE
jgi:hypothetical protein